MKVSFNAVLSWLVVVAILAWSIDYTELGGAQAQRVADLIKWLCIFASYALALIAVAQGRPLPRRFALYVLVFIGVFLPSVLTSEAPERSLITFIRIFSFAPILLIAMVGHPDGRARLFVATFGAVAFVTLSSLPLMGLDDTLNNLGVLTGNSDRSRFAGITTHPNNLAFLSVCIYALCLSVIAGAVAFRDMSWRLWMAMAFGAISAATCVATGSRTGLAAVLIFPLLLWVLRYPALTGGFAFRGRRTAFLVLTTALMFTPLLVVLTGASYSTGGGGGSFDNSNMSRMIAWQAAWDGFLISPFFGVGAGSGIEINSAFEERLSYSHNLLLTWLHYSGFLAGLFALATILLIAWRASTALEFGVRARGDFVRTATAALCLLGIVGFSIIDGALQGNYLFYLITPLLYAFTLRTTSDALK